MSGRGVREADGRRLFLIIEVSRWGRPASARSRSPARLGRCQRCERLGLQKSSCPNPRFLYSGWQRLFRFQQVARRLEGLGGQLRRSPRFDERAEFSGKRRTARVADGIVDGCF